LCLLQNVMETRRVSEGEAALRFTFANEDISWVALTLRSRKHCSPKREAWHPKIDY